MICIKTFANLFDAEAARRTLEVQGLEARLSTDDGTDMTSGFGGVQLFVDDADADRAVAILTAPEAGAASGADQDASAERPRHPAKRVIAGVLWTCGGVVVTVGTYKLTAPSGTFVFAYGAIGYGLYQLARGLVEAIPVKNARPSESPHDGGDH